MTLTEFLLARIAEDEARAPIKHRMDPEGEPGTYYACPATRTEPWGDLPWGPDECDCGLTERRRRALAECEAKRRIVILCQQEDMPPTDAVLVLLSLPYAEHPDFNPSWRL